MQQIGPREIMAKRPCENWDTETVHRLFRNVIKRRTLTLADIPRLRRAKIIDEYDALWLYLAFAPKRIIDALVKEIRRVSIDRWANSGLYNVYVHYGITNERSKILDELEPSEDVLDFFASRLKA